MSRLPTAYKCRILLGCVCLARRISSFSFCISIGACICANANPVAGGGSGMPVCQCHHHQTPVCRLYPEIARNSHSYGQVGEGARSGLILPRVLNRHHHSPLLPVV